MRLSRKTSLQACLAALLGSAAACGGEAPRVEPLPVRPTWVARVGHSYAAGYVVLAQTGHPGLDAQEPPPKRQIGLTPTHRAFADSQWAHREPKAEEHLRRWLSNGSGPILLYVDRSTHWHRLMSLFGAIREESVVAPPLSFMLANRAFPTSYRAARLDAEFAAANGEIRLRAEARRVGTGEGSFTRVVVAGEAHDFASGDGFGARSWDDPAWLESANARWDSIRDRISRSSGAGVAAFSIDETVPWAYVAVMLSFLHEVGVSNVRLEGGTGGAPVGLRLSSPPPFAPVDLTRRDPRDLHPALALGVGALAAVLVTLLGMRRWRGRPRHVRP